MVGRLLGLELRTTVTSAGRVEVTLVDTALPDPQSDEIIVQVEAAPLNPSDIAVLFGPADLASLEAGGDDQRPTLSATIPEMARGAVSARVGQSLRVGGEGAGTIVAAGSGAEHLIGKRVAIQGGGTFAQFRTVRAGNYLVLPDGTEAADAASLMVNPTTALCMVETMRMEGHGAIVHFAASSSLGQMLNKLCLRDGVGLVNVVRREEHKGLLKNAGAAFVLNSTDDDFETQLVEAVFKTGATIAFDPIGGGTQASQALAAMETAAARRMDNYDRYGSGMFKQVYIYGVLDPAPIQLDRWVAYDWAVGGWLVTRCLQRIGPVEEKRLRSRVVNEMTTTFETRYVATINLREMLHPRYARAYARRTTGEKYLVQPTL